MIFDENSRKKLIEKHRDLMGHGSIGSEQVDERKDKEHPAGCDCSCMKNLDWSVEQCYYYIGKEDTTNNLFVIEGMHPEDGITYEHFGKWEDMCKRAFELEAMGVAHFVRIPIKTMKYLDFNKETDKELK